MSGAGATGPETDCCLPRLDRDEEQLVGRRIPCICPRQHEADPPVGETVAVRTSRTVTVERVRCAECDRTWTRINA